MSSLLNWGLRWAFWFDSFLLFLSWGWGWGLRGPTLIVTVTRTPSPWLCSPLLSSPLVPDKWYIMILCYRLRWTKQAMLLCFQSLHSSSSEFRTSSCMVSWTHTPTHLNKNAWEREREGVNEWDKLRTRNHWRSQPLRASTYQWWLERRCRFCSTEQKALSGVGVGSSLLSCTLLFRWNNRISRLTVPERRP